MSELPKLSQEDMAGLIKFFNDIQSSKQNFGETFYGNLIKADKELEKMFNNTHRSNVGYIFLQSVIAVLNIINKGGDWKTMLFNVGVRHKQYDIKDSHYDLVARVLVSTLNIYKNLFPASQTLTMNKLELILGGLMTEFVKGYKSAYEEVLILKD